MYGPHHWHPFAKGGKYGNHSRKAIILLSVLIGSTVYFKNFHNDVRYSSPLQKGDEEMSSTYSSWISDKKNAWLGITPEEIAEIREENESKRLELMRKIEEKKERIKSQSNL